MAEIPRPGILGDWFEPTWPRQPTGMIWEDWQAWQPWLAGPGAAWAAYTYNVHLHTQGLPAGDFDARLLEMWLRSTAKRIDAVGIDARGLSLFEARRNAGWSAVGQLLGYRDLWLINFPDFALVDLWLITENTDDSVRALAQRWGIKTWSANERAF